MNDPGSQLVPFHQISMSLAVVSETVPTSNGNNHPVPTIPPTPFSTISIHLNLLKTSHGTNDKRLASRVLRHLPSIRSKLSANLLIKIIESFSTNSSTLETIKGLLSQLKEMAIEDDGSSQAQSNTFKTVVPDVECYLCLLSAVYLLDNSKHLLSTQVSQLGINKAKDANARSLDPIQAKLFFYLARAHELLSSNDVSLQNILMASLTTSALRHDEDTLATIHTCLLRLHILSLNYDAADRLIEKSDFPEKVPGPLQARHHYYVARIRAVQGRYNDALDSLMQCIRKGPSASNGTDNAVTGVGFLQAVHKLLVTVQLLLGDVPERALFRQPILARPLTPYLALTNAVRLGDLSAFTQIVESYHGVFGADHTLPLIERLHHSVLRAALKRICLAFSRITFAEIARKLGIPSIEDAQYIVMKAIADNVIEASCDLTSGHLTSKALSRAYKTREPQDTLNLRIDQAQAIRRDALQAMRFTERSSKKGSLNGGEKGKGESLLDAAGENEDAFGDDGGDVGMDDNDMGF